MADYYAPIRQGTDIAFLLGVINYCIQNNKIQWDYVKAFTNVAYIVKDGFAYKDGLFTGYDEQKRSYDKSSWHYEVDEQGYAKVDDTWQHPRCVINLLRKHVDRYTPEMVSRICRGGLSSLPGLESRCSHRGGQPRRLARRTCLPTASGWVHQQVVPPVPGSLAIRSMTARTNATQDCRSDIRPTPPGGGGSESFSSSRTELRDTCDPILRIWMVRR